MASTPAMTFSVSCRCGDDFVQLRLPVSSTRSQLELLHHFSDACTGFLQELTPDEANLAKTVQKGIDKVTDFKERLLYRTFRYLGESSALEPVVEGAEVDADLRTSEQSSSEHGEQLLERPPSEQGGPERSIPRDDQKEEEMLPLRRDLAPSAHDPEARGSEATKLHSTIHADVHDGSRATAGSGTERWQTSESARRLQESHPSPQDFQDIMPSTKQQRSGQSRAPFQLFDAVRMFPLPKLRALHRSCPSKVSPEQSQSQTK
eukprot:TRINITY_DN10223_c0_g3_i1.p1 TRINITY_DN10223_c0_g3~~TRINITY_DN10223_c0_g3_i1.p1  ORF type:complete len:262 (-),score=47.15 TRINITY_DN10223_c0_g3_i1:297-1082(-)